MVAWSLQELWLFLVSTIFSSGIVAEKSNNHPLQPYFFKLSVRLRHRRPLEEKEEAREGKGDGGEERRRKAEEPICRNGMREADRLVSGMAIQNRVNGGRDTIRRKHPGGSHTPLSIISAIFPAPMSPTLKLSAETGIVSITKRWIV
ncbi:hypothetical protein Bca4012_044202 [Brassica carinata]|uniref:Secreted protein n=2 Tax=Brassica TaxID=3705 RepID=A0ABQ7CSB3_BRACR|nr:hypothetical protein DY000_02016157 [Brassica cretica]KAG2275716.1 hypothetical protein Bca52824_058271 [Brassica carinata]